jgi:hypothetical protein
MTLSLVLESKKRVWTSFYLILYDLCGVVLFGCSRYLARFALLLAGAVTAMVIRFLQEVVLVGSH